MHNVRLWQLISPSLPVGAFAWSQGLEPACSAGWLHNREQAQAWIGGQLLHVVGRVDAPLFLRLQAAHAANDLVAARAHSLRLLASRESAEMRTEDVHLGQALARLLDDLDVVGASAWRGQPETTFAAVFALACVRWAVAAEAALAGYLWTWLEHQVAAAVKLIPLGQTDGQRLLVALAAHIDAVVAQAAAMNDDDIGASAPAVALASALHETQYTRLFRS